jgi:predicted DNA-binding protein
MQFSRGCIPVQVIIFRQNVSLYQERLFLERRRSVSNENEVTIHIRVTKEVKRKIDDMAAQRGRTKSEYCRYVLTNETHNKEVMDAIQQMTKLVEGCVLFSLGASAALPKYISLITNPEKSVKGQMEAMFKNEEKMMNVPKINIEELLMKEIQKAGIMQFLDFIENKMGGVSQLGIKENLETKEINHVHV